MRVVATGTNGESAVDAVKGRLHELLSRKLLSSGKLIQQSLLTTTRNHFSTIYPGSQHWDPNKVQPKEASGTEGSVDIDVPGATRAYHDIDILPKIRRALTIPMHREAYGRSARDFNDLVFVKKRDGKAFLARKESSGLAFMYFLATRVHQRQDKRLMPSDLTYADNVFARLVAWISKS